MPELSKPRRKRSIRVRLDLLGWMQEQIAKGIYRNLSHAIEIALEKLRSETEGR